MIIDEAGIVTNRILLLGRKESNVYLLKGGDEYAIVGGGMVHIVPDILSQLKELDIEEDKIKRIFILHSHFDHVGIVSFFKKRWPKATVTASKRAKELLSTPKVLDSISVLNQGILSIYGREEEASKLDLDTVDIEIEDVVKGGDKLLLGDLSLEIIDVPGHSSCSIAVYVPEEKAMFASDAGGIPFGDKVFPAGNSNFSQFQMSLEKMAQYDIEVHLAEHYGALTGEEGRNFLNKAIEWAAILREQMEDSYKRTKDQTETTEEITDFILKEAPDQFLPRDVLKLVVGQMTRFIAKSLSSSEAVT